MNMNLFEIELNSRVERLAEFKDTVSKVGYCIPAEYCMRIKRMWSDTECEQFYQMFSSFLFGVFPFTKHTEKQLEAMQMAGNLYERTQHL